MGKIWEVKQIGSRKGWRYDALYVDGEVVYVKRMNLKTVQEYSIA